MSPARPGQWCWLEARSDRACGSVPLSPRSGDADQAIARLTDSVEPPGARVVLTRCLSGELPPVAAVAELLQVTGSVAAVRDVVDRVTHNAAVSSRSGDRLLQDRVDELTQVVLDPDPDTLGAR